MMPVLKQKIENNKVLLANFSYLTILQVFTLLFPFITYPYLLRILGFEIYGRVIFAQTIAANIGILINFGFNISGTNNVACNREDKSKLSQIVSSIYFIKFLIWGGCLIIYSIIIFFIPFLKADSFLFFISFFITFNELLFPVWFFQGIEKMRYITFINIGIRALFVVFIFLFVKSKSDYYIVPLLNSVGAFLGGLIAIYIIIKKEGIKIKRQKITAIKFFFKDSLPLFISSLSTQIYVNANKLIVGAFLGMKDVAIYDLGEKVSTVIKIPIGMFSQATFPKISREKNVHFVNKVMWIASGLIFSLYLIVFVFSDQIVFLLSGLHNKTAVDIVRILSFSAVLIVFNFFLGSNRLVPFGYKKKFVVSQIINCSFFLLGCLFLYLTHFMHLYYISFLYVFTELFMLILNVIINYKLGLLFKKKELSNE